MEDFALDEDRGLYLPADLGAEGRPTTCRICGCTEDDPCADEDGTACSWVAPGVCSACELDA